MPDVRAKYSSIYSRMLNLRSDTSLRSLTQWILALFRKNSQTANIRRWRTSRMTLGLYSTTAENSILLQLFQLRAPTLLRRSSKGSGPKPWNGDYPGARNVGFRAYCLFWLRNPCEPKLNRLDSLLTIDLVDLGFSANQLTPYYWAFQPILILSLERMHGIYAPFARSWIVTNTTRLRLFKSTSILWFRTQSGLMDENQKSERLH